MSPEVQARYCVSIRTSPKGLVKRLGPRRAMRNFHVSIRTSPKGLVKR